MANENNDGDDEEFLRAFGEHTGISVELRKKIDRIRNNDPAYKDFDLSRPYGDDRNLSWELLGRYIARNDHLEEIDFEFVGLTDEIMLKLFEYLTGSSSMKIMNISCNDFGANGIQSMVPFLRNSSLVELSIGGYNANINAGCFRLLIDALRGGSIEELDVMGCSIEDIMALEDCSLPHLKRIKLGYNDIQVIPSLEKYTKLEELHLERNNIGREGCKSIAKLLQNRSSRLRCLNLSSRNFGDEEAEIIANSLKHNNKLTDLYFMGKKIKGDGHRAFLKLLVDVSSIDGTYNSNHTLSELTLPDCINPDAAELEEYVDWAIRINKGKEDEEDESDSEDEEDDYSYEGNPKAVGRKKVVTLQLDSEKRMMLCRLQRTDYCCNSMFAEIDPVLLPEILSIVGTEHSQNEHYRMLIVSVPNLASIVNRKVALRERIAENMARVADLYAEVAAIDAKTLQMKRELESMESRGREHNMTMVSTNPFSANKKLCGKKRDRGAS